VAALAVTVNGTATECASGLTVDQLLQELQLPMERVAVERNRQIVRRDQRAQVRVEDGDVFEIVTFVGGG
jgi:thiamine biosynthesis protein ThiS